MNSSTTILQALPRSSAGDTLQRLLWLRSVMIGIEGAAIWIATAVLHIALDWAWMVVILALLALVTAYTWLRIKRGAQVSELELFCQLLVDVGTLTALLYLSGGSANPFVSLYLLPLVIAATTLPGQYAWTMAGATALCYALLFLFYIPLPSVQQDHTPHGFALHLAGMWVNFVVSAVIISWFVVRMAAAIRRRDAQLARHRENTLRNERIVALGTLAAGAAHELGTPLSTMAVVLGDLAKDRAHEPQLAQDIATLRDQIHTCKQIITRIVAAAGEARAEGGCAQPVDHFVRETLDCWRLLRPSVRLTERLSGEDPAPNIVTEQTLRQAIVNLLNNAADVSPQNVELECRWDREHLQLEIHDRGPGLTAQACEQLGRNFFTTKPAGEGNGIGLLLTRATVERLGGHLELASRDGGGASMLVDLPLDLLKPSSGDIHGKREQV